MAHDLQMVDRIREALARDNFLEKPMFGSLGFMVNGKLCVCVKADEVLYKLSAKDYDEALLTEGCRPMIQNGRIAKGWVFVSSVKLQKQSDFHSWLDKALNFNHQNKDRKGS